MDKKKREIEKIPSWYDRTDFSKIWVALFQRVAEFRAKGERSKCKDGIDTLIIYMFRKERDIVKEYIKKLDAQYGGKKTKADIDKKYDLILEKIIDVLKDGKWLTREGTSTMEEGHEGFEQDSEKIGEGTIEDSEKEESIDSSIQQGTPEDSEKNDKPQGTIKNSKKSIFGGKKRRKYEV